MLDVDALAAQESEDWVWHGAATLPGTHDRAILSLSRGGSDAAVLREFDIAGQGLREPAGSSCRRPRAAPTGSTGTRCCCPAPTATDMATRSGYSRSVSGCGGAGRMSSEAPVLIETAPEHMGLWASVDRTQASETVWFADKAGFFDVVALDGRPHGPEGQAGSAHRHLDGCPPRLAGGEAPHAMGDRR